MLCLYGNFVILLLLRPFNVIPWAKCTMIQMTFNRRKCYSIIFVSYIKNDRFCSWPFKIVQSVTSRFPNSLGTLPSCNMLTPRADLQAGYNNDNNINDEDDTDNDDYNNEDDHDNDDNDDSSSSLLLLMMLKQIGNEPKFNFEPGSCKFGFSWSGL